MGAASPATDQSPHLPHPPSIDRVAGSTRRSATFAREVIQVTVAKRTFRSGRRAGVSSPLDPPASWRAEGIVGVDRYRAGATIPGDRGAARGGVHRLGRFGSALALTGCGAGPRAVDMTPVR